MKNTVVAKSYTLRDEAGAWLAQVVLTNDGMFASVTDWGNFSHAWRSYGDDFNKFILGLNDGYFATKMAQGFAYQGRLNKGAAERFASKILPALKKAIISESEATNG